MGRAPVWILSLLMVGACAGGLGALYKGLSGVDFESLAPPPPKPKPVLPVRLPLKPKAPKFKFMTGRKRIPRPEARARRSAPEKPTEPKRRKARAKKKKDLKTIRKALMRFKRRPRLKFSNLSNVKTRGASSGAYFESPAPRTNTFSESARHRGPAGPAVAPSPVRKRRMRSIAPARGVTVPNAGSGEFEEEYYEEEEEEFVE